MGPSSHPSRSDRRHAQLEHTVYRLLRRIAALLAGDLDGLLSAHGLSASQYDALEALHEAGDEGLSGTRLAASMLVRAPDTTRLLDRLERKGWVERTRRGRDRRVVDARLTGRGRALVADLDAKVLGLHREQLGHLSASALESLRRLLEQVGRGGLAGEDAEPGAGA